MKKVNVKLSEISRGTLSEGRMYGLGHAFCIPGEVFQASQPLSACKDFLNDEVFCEHNQKNYEKYGQKSTPKGLFKDGYAYLLTTFLDTNNIVETSQRFIKDFPKYKKNIKRILSVVNFLEKKLGIEQSELWRTNLKDYYLIKLPLFWVKNTALISLYTLILRNTPFAMRTTSLIKYFNKNTSPEDNYILNKSLRKYLDKFFLKDKVLHDEECVTTDPHNKGIVNNLANRNILVNMDVALDEEEEEHEWEEGDF